MSDHRKVLRCLVLLLSAAGSVVGRRIAVSSLSIKLLPPPARIHPFVSVSEAHYDHTHHTHHHHQEVPEPHFSSTNASREVFLGDTATLDCTVHDLLNESVSWMRQVDEVLELLTWDTHTYVKDDRYRLVHEAGDGWQKWQLVIGDVQTQDVGDYRCQVDTTPPLVLDAALTVTEPRTRVVDERGDQVEEKHYNSGSMIELKCIVEQVPFPHGPVTWRRGATILTFNTSRGGISVKGDEASGFISSRLYVANASPADSGRYSCWYRNYTSDTVTVHVIAGENSQAMQHDAPTETTAAASPASPRWPLVALLTCLTWPPHLSLGR
ncbi:uncharacterized protein LOC123507553 [Portunus trituberculatus]|uniref:uncharacterized protein LOC123507553 n=1 Tax=Portunus trituberculatus TaxID=210409 RepID=UPI001E1CFC7E|nr:uncharacterized protein LOC123507553 [Portunus trituberculatus]